MICNQRNIDVSVSDCLEDIKGCLHIQEADYPTTNHLKHEPMILARSAILNSHQYHQIRRVYIYHPESNEYVATRDCTVQTLNRSTFPVRLYYASSNVRFRMCSSSICCTHKNYRVGLVFVSPLSGASGFRNRTLTTNPLWMQHGK